MDMKIGHFIVHWITEIFKDKMESVATKVLYRATLNPFARYVNTDHDVEEWDCAK